MYTRNFILCLRGITILILCLVTMTGQAQVNPTSALVGSWSGKLEAGQMSLTLMFHLEQADGYVKITMDSPDQSVKGIPVKKECLTDDSLAVKVEALSLMYQARLKEGKLYGTFTQMGFSAPLVLTKGMDEVKRPQNPQPPFPYETEEVTFRNERDSATLAGTLTWPVGYNPKARKKPVVVLFVSGSGQENRDEEIYDHKPFLVIADYLARQGIASLRYDDRATGASVGGNVKDATSEDFARDAAAGLQYLRDRKAFSKVGLIGHSEGGLIAFMLGAQGKTDFIVSMAGTGVKGDTIAASQGNRSLELMGLPGNMTVEKVREDEKIQKVPWYRWFVDYDPSDGISKTRCPVFALNGDLDWQVISSLNLPAIERLLPKSKKNLIKEYTGLNHLFQHCTTGAATEYRQIEETISPEVLSDIAEWIKGLK
ncbi:MAG: alpha/beta hydrolase [Bacteroidaceae bacterium]|nr:alpha/beta hydrolase [Bacteroidaceae bacterium]